MTAPAAAKLLLSIYVVRATYIADAWDQLQSVVAAELNKCVQGFAGTGRDVNAPRPWSVNSPLNQVYA
jgi:hypothetical protein